MLSFKILKWKKQLDFVRFKKVIISHIYINILHMMIDIIKKTEQSHITKFTCK